MELELNYTFCLNNLNQPTLPPYDHTMCSSYDGIFTNGRYNYPDYRLPYEPIDLRSASHIENSSFDIIVVYLLPSHATTILRRGALILLELKDKDGQLGVKRRSADMSPEEGPNGGTNHARLNDSVESKNYQLKISHLYRNIEDSEEMMHYLNEEQIINSDYIICGSDLSKGEKASLKKFARLSGVLVTHQWKQNVTHLITAMNKDRAYIRIIKYLMAILNGWITARLKDKHPVREGNYEITYDIHGCFNGPKSRRIQAMQKSLKLFNQLTFHSSNFEKLETAEVLAPGAGTSVRHILFLKTIVVDDL
ncbi:hypothetical protein IEQ34_019181 [Dendrobium chrysotoxum]|uniref:BRCT domain-containing protein n=1 Tax=Dendrobium chrysotoxum TaxID=161865 RepID=A0AAV7G839_DENCH|nr:hypothetical protein IEQ34_019181 [Dendrobium chrysotoxum]